MVEDRQQDNIIQETLNKFDEAADYIEKANKIRNIDVYDVRKKNLVLELIQSLKAQQSFYIPAEFVIHKVSCWETIYKGCRFLLYNDGNLYIMMNNSYRVKLVDIEYTKELLALIVDIHCEKEKLSNHALGYTAYILRINDY